MQEEEESTTAVKRAGDKENKHACEGLELVFQVKLLLSQNTEVYLQVRADGIFFDCLADLENFISDCFWSRTYKSYSKQGSSCAIHVKTPCHSAVPLP